MTIATLWLASSAYSCVTSLCSLRIGIDQHPIKSHVGCIASHVACPAGTVPHIRVREEVLMAC
jgi:hypothetical protein